MEYKVCTLPGFEGLYWIYEDGQVYSLTSKKFLKQSHSCPKMPKYDYLRVTLLNMPEYLMKVVYIAPLVLHHFKGPKPKGCEANHMDLNKYNNHYTNLEWITHQQNILHARSNKDWKSGREKGYKETEDTKTKQAKAKYKKVLLFNDIEHIIYDSIEQFCDEQDTYRNKFNRLVNSYKTFKGYYIRYL